MLIAFLTFVLSSAEADLARELKRCLNRDQRCVEADRRSPRISELFDEIRSHGTDASLPLLFKLRARGFWEASYARERIFERRLERALPSLSCKPPSASLDDAAYLAAVEAPSTLPMDYPSGEADPIW